MVSHLLCNTKFIKPQLKKVLAVSTTSDFYYTPFLTAVFLLTSYNLNSTFIFC